MPVTFTKPRDLLGRRQIVNRGQVIDRVDFGGQARVRCVVEPQTRAGNVSQDDFRAVSVRGDRLAGGLGRGAHRRNDEHANRRPRFGQESSQQLPGDESREAGNENGSRHRASRWQRRNLSLETVRPNGAIIALPTPPRLATRLALRRSSDALGTRRRAEGVPATELCSDGNSARRMKGPSLRLLDAVQLAVGAQVQSPAGHGERGERAAGKSVGRQALECRARRQHGDLSDFVQKVDSAVGEDG